MITRRAPDKLQRIALLGLGRSGLAAARLALASGLEVVVFDDHLTEIDGLPASCWQDPDDWDFDGLDALILSPGIPHSFPEPHPVAAKALQAGLPIVSDIELCLWLQPASKWVIVTGTNGKSTTTALIGHILHTAKAPHVVGGNLGPALAGLTSPGKDGVRVVEMSSYQLERTPSLRADAAIILNITPDHLDRHGGMDGYVAAKALAIDAVIDGGLCLLGAGAQMEILAAQHPEAMRLATSDLPEAVRHNPALQGSHNLQNIAAASRICQYLGISDAVIAEAITSFSGLPHRLQPCGQLGQIRFINDSKATNGEAASKALAAFDGIYWLAGGLAKEDGLTACLSAAEHIIAGYFYGRDAPIFARQSAGKIPSQSFGDLRQALGAAYHDAHAAGTKATILLSPAAASFDQFTSFEARGEQFMAAVHALILSKTQEGHHA